MPNVEQSVLYPWTTIRISVSIRQFLSIFQKFTWFFHAMFAVASFTSFSWKMGTNRACLFYAWRSTQCFLLFYFLKFLFTFLFLFLFFVARLQRRYFSGYVKFRSSLMQVEQGRILRASNRPYLVFSISFYCKESGDLPCLPRVHPKLFASKTWFSRPLCTYRKSSILCRQFGQ